MNETEDIKPAKAKGRRRFLTGLGASGLAAAVATFVKADPALATYGYGCCTLALPSGSISYCRAHATYIWYCAKSASFDCECCEVKSGGSYTHSAGRCYYS
jgi:hypothetical protein